MSSKITDRIASESGVPQLASSLADAISPSDLKSLLLEVYRRSAKSIREPQVLAAAERTPLLAPCNLDARLLHRFDRVAFEVAQEFEALELSPVCALGTTLALGGIDQNNVLTTIRSAEVL